MFFHHDLKGFDLPPRTLCLTYDDGPGRQTRELGEYLHREGIRATFFMIGRHAEQEPEIVVQLRTWGHLLGNHTYSHPGLVAFAEAGGDVVGEIARTEALLGRGEDKQIGFFRAPYGNWRQKRPESGRDREVSLVANLLNRSGQFPSLIGPVNWDISAADYDFWKRGGTGAECAQAYLEKIERIGRGIVLLHDSSEDPAVQPRNQAFAATRLMVPRLKAEGYRFVGLDEIPQVVAVLSRLHNQVER